jgi:hypothetical protein
VTVFTPVISFEKGTGPGQVYLNFKDKESEMSLKEFEELYIRPTPFNPNSSRAHSIYKGENLNNGITNKDKVKLYDLAGLENPALMSTKMLGINILERSPVGPRYFASLQSLPAKINKCILDIADPQEKLTAIYNYYVHELGLDISCSNHFGKKCTKKPDMLDDQKHLKAVSDLDWAKKTSSNPFCYSKLTKPMPPSLDRKFINDPNTRKKLQDYAEKYYINTKTFIHLREDKLPENRLHWELIKDYYKTFGNFYIEESMRRVFEGIYITRTLHELNEIFAPGSLKKYPNGPNKNSSSKGFGLNGVDSFYVFPTEWKSEKKAQQNRSAPKVRKNQAMINAEKLERMTRDAAENMKQVQVRLNKSNQEKVVTNFVKYLEPKGTIQKNVIVGLMTPCATDKSDEQHAVHMRTYDYLQKIKENLNNMESNKAPAAQ